jgi:hypothetical protein
VPPPPHRSRFALTASVLASRVLSSVVAQAAKLHAKAAVDGLLVPLVTQEPALLCPPIAEVGPFSLWVIESVSYLFYVHQLVAVVCKSQLTPDLITHFLAQLLRQSALRVRAASSGASSASSAVVWNESSVQVVTTLLALKPSFDTATSGQPAASPFTAFALSCASSLTGLLINVLEHVTNASVPGSLRSSTKLISLVTTFVRSFPSVATPFKPALQTIAASLSGWAAKGAVTAVNKL